MIEAKFLDMKQRQCYVYISKKYIFDWKDILILNREHINFFYFNEMSKMRVLGPKKRYFSLFFTDIVKRACNNYWNVRINVGFYDI